jgi:opacity protein-like surface antigen
MRTKPPMLSTAPSTGKQMGPTPHLVVLAFGLILTGPVRAQSVEGGTASVIVSGTTIDGGASLGIAGAIGYRFTSTFGISVELTAVPSFNPELPAAPTPVPLGSVGGIVFPAPSYSFSGEEGHATIFTANLRLEMPTGFRRLVPYVIGGAGVGHVREEFTVAVSYPPRILTSLPGIPPTPGLPTTTIYLPPIALESSRASTGLAVTFGGGISRLLAEHWSLDADLRYLAVLGNRDLHIGRFGGGVSYRF